MDLAGCKPGAARALDVLHVSWSGSGGGAERHVVDLACGLHAQGCGAAVLYLSSDGGVGEDLARHGVRFVNLGLSHGWDPSGPVRVAAVVRRLRPRIIHDHVSTPWLRAALVRGPATCVAATEHGHLLRRSYARRWLRLQAERRGGRRTDYYLAPSQALADAIRRELRFPSERIRVVPHGVAPPSWHGDPRRRLQLRQNVRAELDLPVGAVVALFVGHLDENKGAPLLLEGFGRAATLAPDLSLMLVGRGPLSSQLRQRAAELGLDERVRLTGFRRDLERLYAAADLLVLPSWSEGFGLVILDAMAAGLPVVATRVGAIPEIVVDQQTGLLVPPGRTDEIAAALLRLAGAPEIREALGRAGQDRWAAHYTLDQCVTRTLEAYRWMGAWP